MWQRFKNWCKNTWNKLAAWWQGTGIGSRITNAVNWISNQIRKAPYITSFIGITGAMATAVIYPVAGPFLLLGLAASVVIFSSGTVMTGLMKLGKMCAAMLFGFSLLCFAILMFDPALISMIILADGTIGTSIIMGIITIICTAISVVYFGWRLNTIMVTEFDMMCEDYLEATAQDSPNRKEVEQLRSLVPQLAS